MGARSASGAICGRAMASGRHGKLLQVSPYFFPSCRAASASIMRSSQLASERPSAFAKRSAVALTDSLTRTFIAVSRFSAFGFLFATPLLLPVVPRDLSFNQALKPVGKRAAVFLCKPLGRRFDGFFDPHVHRSLAPFRFRLLHSNFLAKPCDG